MLDQKIIECDNELRRIQQQLKNLPSGASKQGLQTKAKNILVRKKRFEQQAETYREKAFNIDSLADSIKAAEDIKVVAGVMKNGVKQLKNDLQKIDLDKIENCQQELNDLIDMTDEVEAAIQRSYEIPQDIDDDELNAQLELLGDEIVLDSDPSYIDAVLHSPEVASISGIDKKVTPSNAPRASNVVSIKNIL